MVNRLPHESRIIVDADACPVKTEIVQAATEFQVPVLFIASFAAYQNEAEHTDIVQYIYVDQGFQSADMYIANTARSGDIVVTNDYGLAALCLPRGAWVLTPRGKELDGHNMDELLAQRHVSSKARRAGQRTKGPRAMTTLDREHFQHKLTKLLQMGRRTS
ncbi:YaiI/YqxD family protein [Paenibacillus sp. ACRRX]|uniref:YaiI/YqxD family protein n=1 Tax=unclassified Paenibacillus TaxID=185978 RepID=UPI001EF601B2|nr:MULTISPECIES: YaiI/YqxD family protein [unclassified Paenibacillus]MCG7407835.1 YaiI/YqxD family protein [Paenibacillus sp. ACRRX]MDK8180978.1 YaiI/YqxD family protein [Paenibacillus sp. UMB4589-SE434]